MSVHSVIRGQANIARFKPFRPQGRRKITPPLVAVPKSNRSSLVGPAFDYLLRFELKRRMPYAVVRDLVSPAIVALPLGDSTVKSEVAFERLGKIFAEAKSAVATFTRIGANVPCDPEQLKGVARR
jgi:hypothetical protein